MSKYMSPQARRRLNDCLHGQEWLDLAAEVADALELAGPVVLGEAERAVILLALRGERQPEPGEYGYEGPDCDD